MSTVEIPIPIEEYDKLKEIADDVGVTVDQYTQVFFTGYMVGVNTHAELSE